MEVNAKTAIKTEALGKARIDHVCSENLNCANSNT